MCFVYSDTSFKSLLLTATDTPSNRFPLEASGNLKVAGADLLENLLFFVESEASVKKTPQAVLDRSQCVKDILGLETNSPWKKKEHLWSLRIR